MELGVVTLVLIAAFGEGVVTEIELPTPTGRDVRIGSVRREPTEDGDVSRLKEEGDGTLFVDRIGR